MLLHASRRSGRKQVDKYASVFVMVGASRWALHVGGEAFLDGFSRAAVADENEKEDGGCGGGGPNAGS